MISRESTDRRRGFTLIELTVAIAVIAILASLGVVTYGNWRGRTADKQLQSDLKAVASAMEQTRNFSSSYPSTIPSSFKPSPDSVIEMTTSASGKYCINAYHKKTTSLLMSVSSDDPTNPSEGLCSGAASGSTVGGTVPPAPLAQNIAPDFGSWSLTGTTVYNSTSKELTFGANGTARYSTLRVSGATGVAVNGQFYATAQSGHASLQPDGGWYLGASYYGADGTTPQQNTAGYTANGCAKKVTLGSWNASKQGDCTFALGNGIVYMRLDLYSGASVYPSSDLKMKSPSVILN